MANDADGIRESDHKAQRLDEFIIDQTSAGELMGHDIPIHMEHNGQWTDEAELDGAFGVANFNMDAVFGKVIGIETYPYSEIEGTENLQSLSQGFLATENQI